MCTSVGVSMSSLPKDHTFKAVSLCSFLQFSCESKKKKKKTKVSKFGGKHWFTQSKSTLNKWDKQKRKPFCIPLVTRLVKVTQLCPTLYNPMDDTVHGIL